MDVPEIKSGKWIWAPPPGASDVAVDQLRLARFKKAAFHSCVPMS